MKDNTTSQPAHKYDAEIEKTHPMYKYFNRETLNLVEVVNPKPERWLDTGCGTGILATGATEIFKETHFVLADPSEAMLAVAKDKLGHNNKIEFLQAGTEDIHAPKNSYDVITAILSHHYFDRETRKSVTLNCYNMLKEGGVYVTFENISPNNEKGIEIGLKYWEHTQIKEGKSVEAAQKYKQRFDVEYHPITIESHLELLREVGFSVSEILLVSGLRAGFFAIK